MASVSTFFNAEREPARAAIARYLAGGMPPAFTLLLDTRSAGPMSTRELEQLAADAERGGLFAPGVAHELHTSGEVLLHFDAGQARLAAQVVFASPHGVGLELSLTPQERKTLCAHLEAALAARRALDADDAPLSALAGGDRPTAAPEDGGAEDGGAEEAGDQEASAREAALDELELPQDAAPRGTAYSPVAVRLRNLSLAEQQKVAQRGEHQERVLLERLYGKLVWEALLRNPRITTPEVARIAKMGALPKPLLEIILSNGGWIQVPEIRRALLGNPRLAAEHIPKLLRLLPRHELKLLPSQTAYPQAVRDWARRLLRL